jgi:hypothetical protein
MSAVIFSVLCKKKPLKGTKINTVKRVLRGHLWDKEKVVLYDRLPHKRGSIHITFSMTRQEKCDLVSRTSVVQTRGVL